MFGQSKTARVWTKYGVVAVAASCLLAGCAIGGGDGSSGGSSDGPIKVGLVTSLTGAAASYLGQTEAGAQARIDVLNNAGGINGRKIELVTVDDQSTPQGAETGVRTLVDRENVTVVLGYSGFLYAGYKYLQSKGVPVVGGGFDGPEWGQQPNTNMFNFVPQYSLIPPEKDGPAAKDWGLFFKQIGVDSVGLLAYGDSESAIQSATQIAKSIKEVGLRVGYTNYTLPQQGGDFTSIALNLKKENVGAYICVCGLTTELSLGTAAEQGGVNAVGIHSTGYDQAILDDPSMVKSLEGDYFYSFYKPYELGGPGIEEMLANLKKHAQGYKGGIPSFGLSGGYLSADVAIRGLQEAGKNPTRESFTKGLRSVTDYSANGVLSAPITFSLDQFGKSPDPVCSNFVQLKQGKFVPLPQVCGALIR